MSTAAGVPTGFESKRAWAEAAAWVVRLHGPGRNADMESGWRRWLNESPEHLVAWEVATDMWNESHDIPIGLAHPPTSARWFQSRTRARPIVLAVAIAASLVMGWAIQFLGPTVVSTVVGEQRTMNLEDGTRIELNTDTRLIVQYDGQTRKVVLRSGEAYFQVAHEHRPFVVMAGDRKVVAVGTAFTVRHDQAADDPLTVTLIEGRVAVAPADARNILPAAPVPEITMLTAGERLRLHRHARASIDMPQIDRVTGWMRGQLVFDHTPLGEAAEELNRYSTVRLMVPAVSDRQLPIGGTFRVSDAESFARAVSQTYGLQLVRSGNEIVLGPRRQDDLPDPDSSVESTPSPNP